MEKIVWIPNVPLFTEAKRQVFLVSFAEAVKGIVEVQKRIFAAAVDFWLFERVALEVVEQRGRSGNQDLQVGGKKGRSEKKRRQG